ncbi:MAG: hypothetical protein FWD94_00340 [Treponema sp.]|nr:hypothetical protein [Treponema sp.]
MKKVFFCVAVASFACSGLFAQQWSEFVSNPEYFRFVRNAVRNAPRGILAGEGLAEITDGDVGRARSVAHTRAVLDVYRRIKPFAAVFLPELAEIDFRREVVDIVNSDYPIDGAIHDGAEEAAWGIFFIDSIFASSSITEEGIAGDGYRVSVVLSDAAPSPSPDPPSRSYPDSVSAPSGGDPVGELVRDAWGTVPEGTLLGIGTASMPTRAMSRSVALFRARTEIARQLDLTVRNSVLSEGDVEDLAVVSKSLVIACIVPENLEKATLDGVIFAETLIDGEYVVIVTMAP